VARVLNINTTNIVKFTNKLEKLHRSALPVAVRTSLNSAAFDVKQKTMPLSAKQNFTQRRKTFFEAKSKVKPAKGFNIKSMESKIGFFGGETNQAVRDLKKQERGGVIGGRSYIPMKSSRVSGENFKSIRKKNRFGNIKDIINAKDGRGNIGRRKRGKGKNAGQRFMQSVAYAGKGGLVLSEKFRGKIILWRVNSLKRTKDGNFKLTALYTYEEGRSVKIDKATRFMKSASDQSAKKIERFFIKEAKKQINRLK